MFSEISCYHKMSKLGLFRIRGMINYDTKKFVEEI